MRRELAVQDSLAGHFCKSRLKSGQKFALEPVEAEPYIVPFYQTGDLNRDHETGVADLVLMEQYLLGAEKELADWTLADFDGDEAITAYDMVLLRKKICEADKAVFPVLD